MLLVAVEVPRLVVVVVCWRFAGALVVCDWLFVVPVDRVLVVPVVVVREVLPLLLLVVELLLYRLELVVELLELDEELVLPK